MLKVNHAVLVYQKGIANMFAVGEFGVTAKDRNYTKRLVKGDIRRCEAFALGMVASGTAVITMLCDEYGDISEREWHTLETTYSSAFAIDYHPVSGNLV